MPHLRFLPALALLLTGTLALGQANAQTTTSNETVPRKLVDRLIGSPGIDQQLLIGRLPEQLPVDMPMPDNAQVIGSVVTVVNNQENIQVLLDVPQSTEQVRTFYEDRLRTAGWKTQQSFSDNRGFLPTNFGPSATLALCKGNEGPMLFVTAIPVQNSLTDVRLNLDTNPNNPACQAGGFAQPFPNVPLPTLPAPPNAQVNLGGGGGSDDYQLSRAMVKTELDTQALADYYENQFKQAGWTRLNGQLTRSAVFSTWTLKDEKGKSWLGILSFTPVEGVANQYSASVMVSQL